MCESFGHCATNSFIDDAVRLLVQQMSLGSPAWPRGIFLTRRGATFGEL